MKVLVDMNLSPRWVEALAEAGIDATHWSSIGVYSAPDPEIIAHAEANGFIVLTHDLDFGAILAITQGVKPSVVQIRADNVGPGAIGAQVIASLKQMATELEEGALITVDPKRARLRLLPFKPAS